MIKLVHYFWMIYFIVQSTQTTVKFAFSFLQENLMGTDWRNIKGQVLASGNGSRQPSRKQFVESSPSDSKSTEASTSMSVDDLGAVDSASVPSTSRAAEVSTQIKKCLQKMDFIQNSSNIILSVLTHKSAMSTVLFRK